MPTVISHAVAALGIGACFHRPSVPRRIWALGAGYAMLPDADVLGFPFGVAYGDMLGHRGLTHSLTFAAVLSAATVWLAFRNGVPGLSATRLAAFLFLVTASHGVLDAFTNGGLGVAFFAPFDATRYFFPVRPIEVSPIGIGPFFSARGLSVLRSEIVWVWLPSMMLGALAIIWRRVRSPTGEPGSAAALPHHGSPRSRG